MRLFSFRYKDIKGNESDYDIGVKGPNVTQDSTHRFVTDAEKAAWNAKLGKTGDASNLTAAFSQATTRANLKTGEKLSVSLGKIMKVIADLKTVSFSGSYADLSNKPTIPSGAAASYPVANNDTTNNSGYLVTAQVAYTHGKEIDKLSSDLAAAKTSFQGGVDTLYNKCVSCGATPTAKTPTAIAAAIQAIFTNRYNTGVAAGKNAASGSYSNANASTPKTINCGFRPSAIMIMDIDPGRRGFMVYDSSISADHVYVGYSNGGVSYYSFAGYDESHDVDRSSMFAMSLTNTGFTLKDTMNSGTVHWFAFK